MWTGPKRGHYLEKVSTPGSSRQLMAITQIVKITTVPYTSRQKSDQYGWVGNCYDKGILIR